MHISEINIYPIKSLKGITVPSALVEDRGLRHDRRWMLTDRAGKFMTQREFPRMAAIAVEVTSDGLRVTSENEGTMEIPFEPDSGERGRVTIWNSVCDAEVYLGPVSEWFSDALGIRCQLVYMPDGSRRNVNERFNEGREIVSFADGYPLLVISEASLADLNGRIDEAATKADRSVRAPLPMNRFRPNMVVADSEAYAEDGWVRIRVGEAVFRSTKPCERCVITTVDQANGEFDGKEPLKTLASYRMAKYVMPEKCEALGVNETAVLFGQNLIAETPGATITIDDTIVVVQIR
ncbi:MAG: MOSC N-terminal beta barrel domain-containing protein [Pyrinomonadaceae bacterium]